jgi:sugar O-acyltransferase (sialic acid O-acetyltransferase NeuD family)
MSPKNIYIYGAGGAGRELAFTLSLGNRWRVMGFIDDTPELAGKIIGGIPVVGHIGCLAGQEVPIAVCIVDKPIIKRAVVERAMAQGQHNYPCVVGSDRSIVSPAARLGLGCIVSLPYNFISPDVMMGDFVFVNCTTRIGHDVKIGDYTTIFSGIDIGGFVEIGKDCVIGSGSVINPGIHIGDGSIIGGGAVVVKNIPAGVIAAGCPARIIREINNG